MKGWKAFSVFTLLLVCLIYSSTYFTEAQLDSRKFTLLAQAPRIEEPSSSPPPPPPLPNPPSTTTTTTTTTTPDHVDGVVEKPSLKPTPPIIEAPSLIADDPGQTSDCETMGFWVIDNDYANSAQYKLLEQAGDADRGRVEGGPFRSATTYAWTNECSGGGGDLKRLEIGTFCEAMNNHGLSRVVMVGDSISFMMFQSLWKLLGIPNEPKEQMNGGSIQTFACPDGSIIDLRYFRNDYANQPLRQSCRFFRKSGSRANVEYYRCKPGESAYCFPWAEDYESSDKPTLLVVNMGTHFHAVDEFTSKLNDLEAFLVETRKKGGVRAKDVVVFRASAAGHKDCMNFNVPFKSASENVITTDHEWNLIPEYNILAKERLSKLEKTYFLNTEPMTVLRPDGHRGSGDCLHYYLPGVPDWWNHLMVHKLSTSATTGQIAAP